LDELKLASKLTGKILFNSANVPLAENQIFRVNVDQPPEDPRQKDSESISTGSVKESLPVRRSREVRETPYYLVVQVALKNLPDHQHVPAIPS